MPSRRARSSSDSWVVAAGASSPVGGSALAPRPPWADRTIVLGVTGGIAAYKVVQAARDLTRLGARVEVVLTEAAARFVAPLSFEGVTGRGVHRSPWSARGGALHMRLARDADLVLVAPATADLLARAAQGRADDLLTTLLLATSAPVILAPAMNHRMWAHPQVRANARHCSESLGYHLVGPDAGALAVGEGEGEGRMVEPRVLVEWAGARLGRSEVWAGRQVVITAGPTRESLDPIRFVSNRSSGRMGFAIAREAWLRGAEVTLVTGPSPLPDPVGVEVVRVESAQEMLEAVRPRMAGADVVVYASAVSDYRSTDPAREKIRKSEGDGRFELALVETPDIARETASDRSPAAVAIGFALETTGLEERAAEKMREKGFHLIAANPAGEEGAGFEVETNRVTLLDRWGGREALPVLPKAEVARRLMDRVETWLAEGLPEAAGAGS